MKNLIVGLLIFVVTLIIGVMAQTASAVKANSPPIIKEKAVPCYRASVKERKNISERNFRFEPFRVGSSLIKGTKDNTELVLPSKVKVQPQIVHLE